MPPMPNFFLPRVLLDVTLVLMGLCTVLALRTINKPSAADGSTRSARSSS